MNDSFFLSPISTGRFLCANARADEIQFTLQQFAFISPFFGHFPFGCCCFVVLSPQPASIHAKWIFFLFVRLSRNMHVCNGLSQSFSVGFLSIGRPKTKWMVAYHMHPQLPNEFPSNLISKWFKQIAVEKVLSSNPFDFFIHPSNGKLKRCQSWLA